MATREIRWSVKVHRSITHIRKLGEASLSTLIRFVELFKPLGNYIDFYLIQLPPNFRATDKNVVKLRAFTRSSGLSAKLAIEFRDTSWFTDDTLELCRELGVTAVSVDSPIGTWITSSNGIVYLRLHGRLVWYSYDYSQDELEELARKVIDLDPRKVYTFFNNNHWMLQNARTMLSILSRK